MLSLALALALTASPEAATQGVVSHEMGDRPIQLKVDHGFTLADAHARVQQLLDYWGQAFGVRYEWAGERVWVKGVVWGVQFHAYLEVAANAVSAVASDPGWLRNNAKDYVKKKLQKYLHPRYEEP